MNNKTRSIALSFIMLAGVVGVIYVWMNYGSTPDSTQAPQLTKKTNGKIMLDGTIVPEKNADLGFVIPAKITSINKKVGDSVKTGEILAVEDASDLRAQLNVAQAQANGAKLQIDVLNHDLKKEKLKVHDFSGRAKEEQKAQVSSSEDTVEVQKSALSAALAGVASARAQLDKAIIRTPFDGVITRQDGEVGEVGGASVPAFITVSSSEPLKKIEAFVSDLDVANIKIGDKAQVAFDFMGTEKTIGAKVTSIDPGTNSSPSKVTYKVTLILNQSDEHFKSGMHASVTF